MKKRKERNELAYTGLTFHFIFTVLLDSDTTASNDVCVCGARTVEKWCRQYIFYFHVIKNHGEYACNVRYV